MSWREVSIKTAKYVLDPFMISLKSIKLILNQNNKSNNIENISSIDNPNNCQLTDNQLDRIKVGRLRSTLKNMDQVTQ